MTLHYTYSYNYSCNCNYNYNYTNCITLHYTNCITLHYTTPHHTTLNYTTHYITLHYSTLHLLYFTLHYITLHYHTVHYITLQCTHYTTHHICNCNCATLITLHHNYSSTTVQLQLQLQLRHTTSSSCGWGDRPGDHCNHCPQPLQKTQHQPPFGPSLDSLCHPWFTTTNLSYRFPIFETSATALCGTTGIMLFLFLNFMICICKIKKINR